MPKRSKKTTGNDRIDEIMRAPKLTCGPGEVCQHVSREAGQVISRILRNETAADDAKPVDTAEAARLFRWSLGR